MPPPVGHRMQSPMSKLGAECIGPLVNLSGPHASLWSPTLVAVVASNAGPASPRASLTRLSSAPSPDVRGV